MVDVGRRGDQDAEPNQDAPLDVFHRWATLLADDYGYHSRFRTAARNF